MLAHGMKSTLFILCLLTISAPALNAGTFKDGSHSHNTCGYTRGVSNCSTCQCADQGRHRNTCISDARYCEAFGNPGGR